MKDQYVADIGDYGKLALLKEFCDAGIRVGVNWYYTKNDGSTDGRFVGYLEDDGYMRGYCPQVYDTLRHIYKTDRSIKAVEKSGILKGAVFYGGLMDFSGMYHQKTEQRFVWAEKAERCLKGTELIFLDPDNGLLTSKKAHIRNPEKCILPIEIERLFEYHNVVYYCHKGRRTKEKWEEYKSLMLKSLPGAIPFVITFHKGTQRSFVFLVHRENAEQYKKILESFVSRWGGIFTMEHACLHTWIEL